MASRNVLNTFTVAVRDYFESKIDYVVMLFNISQI